MQKYLVPCDTTHIICIDERPRDTTMNAIHIPGAIYGIVDAFKAILNYSEDEAWEKIIAAAIPPDVHTDDHHHDNEALGCGYATLQKIPASERFQRAKKAGGLVLHYTGSHKPKHAIIVYRKGMTIDQKQAWDNEEGAFVFDYWAAEIIGEKLGVDPKKFAFQLEKEFKDTVIKLSGITEFIKL